MRSFFHIIPEKWFVLFWMCDFVALTRCCKLVSFLCFIFAVLLANLIRPIICQIFEGSRELRHAPFRENFYRLIPRPLGFPKTKKLRTKFEVPSSSSFEDMIDRMLKILGVTWPKPCPLWGKLFTQPVGIPCAKLRTELEVSSSNSFEDFESFAKKFSGHVI